MPRAIKYTADQIQWVSENRTLLTSELHTQFCAKFIRFDVSANNLNALRKRNGWKTGRTGRFEKGHTPSPLARPKGPNKTSFKKGQKPPNLNEVGTIRKRDGYYKQKIGHLDWQFMHRIEWIKHNGPIPKNHVVAFIDGDHSNWQIDNLELLTRKQHLSINSQGVNNYPQDCRQSVRLIGKLKSKISEVKE